MLNYGYASFEQREENYRITSVCQSVSTSAAYSINEITSRILMKFGIRSLR
jgi:hypothetical protein